MPYTNTAKLVINKIQESCEKYHVKKKKKKIKPNLYCKSIILYTCQHFLDTEPSWQQKILTPLILSVWQYNNNEVSFLGCSAKPFRAAHRSPEHTVMPWTELADSSYSTYHSTDCFLLFFLAPISLSIHRSLHTAMYSYATHPQK